jgi:hypothetical protein
MIICYLRASQKTKGTSHAGSYITILATQPLRVYFSQAADSSLWPSLLSYSLLGQRLLQKVKESYHKKGKDMLSHQLLMVLGCGWLRG